MSVMLTSAMRANLSALQSTATLMGVTQERLATGKRVNSPMDDPTAYFSAKQGQDSANALTELKSAMGEGLQTLKTATTSIDAAIGVLKQMKSLVNQAKSTTDTASQKEYAAQYNELQSQLDDLVTSDAEYKGTNLLKGNAIKLQLSETASSSITISHADITGDSKYIATSTATTGAALGAAGTVVDTAIKNLQSLSKTLSSSSAYVQTRVDFASSMASILKTGADNLVAADTNEEGANMLMLQTRNQLGTSSLSMSAQAAQSVLRLF